MNNRKSSGLAGGRILPSLSPALLVFYAFDSEIFLADRFFHNAVECDRGPFSLAIWGVST